MAEEGEDQELVGSTNELLFSTNTLVKLVGLTVCGLQMGLGVLCMYSLGWEKTEGFKGGIYFTTAIICGIFATVGSVESLERVQRMHEGKLWHYMAWLLVLGVETITLVAQAKVMAMASDVPSMLANFAGLQVVAAVDEAVAGGLAFPTSSLGSSATCASSDDDCGPFCCFRWLTARGVIFVALMSTYLACSSVFRSSPPGRRYRYYDWSYSTDPPSVGLEPFNFSSPDSCSSFLDRCLLASFPPDANNTRWIYSPNANRCYEAACLPGRYNMSATPAYEQWTSIAPHINMTVQYCQRMQPCVLTAINATSGSVSYLGFQEGVNGTKWLFDR